MSVSRTMSNRVGRHLGLAVLLTAEISCAPRADKSSQPPPPIQSAQSTPLIVEPSPILLGTLRQGQAAHADLTVTNSSNQAVVVTRFTTSCPCVNIKPKFISIDPGRLASIRVDYSPEDSPDFHGLLLVEIIGQDSHGQVVLTTAANIEVVAGTRITLNNRSHLR